MEVTAWQDSIWDVDADRSSSDARWDTANRHRKIDRKDHHKLNRKIRGGTPSRWQTRGLVAGPVKDPRDGSRLLAAYELALFGAAILAIFLLPG